MRLILDTIFSSLLERFIVQLRHTAGAGLCRAPKALLGACLLTGRRAARQQNRFNLTMKGPVCNDRPCRASEVAVSCNRVADLGRSHREPIVTPPEPGLIR